MSKFFDWLKSLFKKQENMPPAAHLPPVAPQVDKPAPIPVDERPAYIVLALSFIGIREITGDKDNPTIVEFFTATSYFSTIKKMLRRRDEVAWCAAFRDWILRKSGYQDANSAGAIDGRKIGVKASVPKAYMVAVWKHLKGSLKGHYHTNFLISPIIKNGVVIGWNCVGGNQSNAVTLAPYYYSDHELYYCAMPPQVANGPTAPLPLKPPAPINAVDLASLKKGTKEWYAQAFKVIAFDRGYEERIASAARKVANGKAQYMEIEILTGVPWYMIGVIHSLEASSDFKACLHNGERIIGTGRKTTLVPRGRGPFATWKEAALDAIKIESVYQNDGGAWPIGHVLKLLELYNGAGYLKNHTDENSPYLWACSNINDGKGKYVADGKWSASADTHGQVGCATLIKQLELWGELKIKWV